MILRHILYGILFGVMWVLSILLYPFIYPFFDHVYWNKTPILWWFINSDEPSLFQNKYGADWWRDKKRIRTNNCLNRFLASYRWNAIRNPHYNLKLILSPSKGIKYDIRVIYHTTEKDPLMFCNELVQGKQYVTYRILGRKYFRYSFTKKFLWFVLNVQMGSSDLRHIYKVRLWNKKILK